MTHKNSTHPFPTCNFTRWIGATLLPGLLCLLSACNLGSDEESVQATTSALLAATPSASITPAAGTGSTASGSSQTAATTCSITAFQAAVMAEVNRRRASAQSCGVASAHANDMVTNNFFAHTGSSGSSVSARINAIGYAWASVGENIAAGQPTVSRVVDAWMGSDGHCANLMNPAMEEFAVACVYNTANRSNYWVMDLAKPR
jgi:uncharacterized protein YkwD